MGITHVVRGNEYLSSTPKYNLIYESFGWDIPTYVHVPPVMKDEQHKLSKRNGDASFQDLVKKGYLPEAILNYIALLGWSPETEQEIYTLDELIKVFDIKRISKSPAIFDIDKLTWMNGMYLRAMSEEQFCELAKPYIEKAVFIRKNSFRNIYVCTSDHAEQNQILGSGGLRISARELLRQVERSKLDERRRYRHTHTGDSVRLERNEFGRLIEGTKAAEGWETMRLNGKKRENKE